MRSVDQTDVDPNTNPQDQPQLFGQAFEGPMWGHEPWAGSPYLNEKGLPGWMPIHYELHAWIWKKNPDGVFAIGNGPEGGPGGYNPNVNC